MTPSMLCTSANVGWSSTTRRSTGSACPYSFAARQRRAWAIRCFGLRATSASIRPKVYGVPGACLLFEHTALQPAGEEPAGPIPAEPVEGSRRRRRAAGTLHLTVLADLGAVALDP